MNISVILGHPSLQSFNHAIAREAVAALQENGHRVFYHDLYEEGFDPILWGADAKGAVAPPGSDPMRQELTMSDGLIIVHPNWWGQPPAIVKGWVDRYISERVAYLFPDEDEGGGVPIGLFSDKRVLIFNTSNTPKQREKEVFGDPLQILWKHCIFDYCGVKTFHRRMFSTIVNSTLEERRGWLQEVRETTGQFFPKQA
ncbi:NAD(P)H dehydrogenase (quinone) [Paenibacillus sp. J31TS4]|uniref:NAD(P)H-dependent oxidoreductase n=1 Tax=Paenibacillus sp. J31TS4 TaxID=2807195 RepID=UPI001B188BE7|nr:NAD(P)H-dependent oxidoreductase [Paenibacillus sp. J31TS4]GIP37587.1 NAD(P)H dehydrogenase (quinone) [Paenibacillus sp. J31TS4]